MIRIGVDVRDRYFSFIIAIEINVCAVIRSTSALQDMEF